MCPNPVMIHRVVARKSAAPGLFARPRRALAAGLMLLSPALPAAEGWYANAVFGLASQSDQSFEWSDASTRQRSDAQLDSGALAGGALGWEFGNGWRVEGEFVYQSVDSESTGFVAPAPRGTGNFASTALAINALYSVDWWGSPKARTHFGAGWVRLTEVDVDFETPAGERSYSGSGNGFQLLAGVRYDLGERWFLDAGLRWLRATTLDLDAETNARERIRTDYTPWAVTLGLGWRF